MSKLKIAGKILPDKREKEEYIRVPKKLFSDENTIETCKDILPQVIIFDPIPLANGDYVSIANIYTHMFNPNYALGRYEPINREETIAIINTMEYVFMNRVKYFITVLVQSCICKMKKRFYDINEYELYNDIINKINKDFSIIYRIESYIEEDSIIINDTVSHIVISIDTLFYNCLLNSMIGYPLNKDDHDFISSLVREFDMIISDYFDIYILEEIRTIYGPQLSIALKKGEEIYGLNTF